MRFLLVCQTVLAQAEHLMVKGTHAEQEAVYSYSFIEEEKDGSALMQTLIELKLLLKLHYWLTLQAL